MVSFHIQDRDWPPEYKLVVARAEEELRILTGYCDRAFGLSEAAWNLDLDSGTVVFTSKEGIKATCAVQIAGTYNPRDGTWLWAWDHPSLQPPLRLHALAARAFGEAQGIACLTKRKFECSEDDAWRLTAVACHLGKGQGAYRGPTDGADIFMTLASVVLKKEEPNQPLQPTRPFGPRG
jgi:hypothetical protein